jgi:signal transduction histidine kinase
MADKHGLFVELATQKDSVPLPENIKTLLFESVRELLFNAAKHSHARSASVSVRSLDGNVQVVVSDKGVGFDPKAIPPAGDGRGGFGFLGIHERLALIGGNLEIESAPGSGSRFVVTVPAGSVQVVESVSPTNNCRIATAHCRLQTAHRRPPTATLLTQRIGFVTFPL